MNATCLTMVSGMKSVKPPSLSDAFILSWMGAFSPKDTLFLLLLVTRVAPSNASKVSRFGGVTSMINTALWGGTTSKVLAAKIVYFPVARLSGKSYLIIATLSVLSGSRLNTNSSPGTTVNPVEKSTTFVLPMPGWVSAGSKVTSKKGLGLLVIARIPSDGFLMVQNILHSGSGTARAKTENMLNIIKKILDILKKVLDILKKVPKGAKARVEAVPLLLCENALFSANRYPPSNVFNTNIIGKAWKTRAGVAAGKAAVGILLRSKGAELAALARAIALESDFTAINLRGSFSAGLWNGISAFR